MHGFLAIGLFGKKCYLFRGHEEEFAAERAANLGAAGLATDVDEEIAEGAGDVAFFTGGPAGCGGGAGSVAGVLDGLGS